MNSDKELIELKKMNKSFLNKYQHLIYISPNLNIDSKGLERSKIKPRVEKWKI
mgnify:CR=1 FL=1